MVRYVSVSDDADIGLFGKFMAIIPTRLMQACLIASAWSSFSMLKTNV